MRRHWTLAEAFATADGKKAREMIALLLWDPCPLPEPWRLIRHPGFINRPDAFALWVYREIGRQRATIEALRATVVALAKERKAADDRY